jgi:hypothetical protein
MMPKIVNARPVTGAVCAKADAASQHSEIVSNLRAGKGRSMGRNKDAVHRLPPRSRSEELIPTLDVVTQSSES